MVKEYVIAVLFSYFMAYVMVDSFIFGAIHEEIEVWSSERGIFYKLINCYACTGFWTSLLATLLLLDTSGFLDVTAHGGAGSMTVFFLATIQDRLEKEDA